MSTKGFIAFAIDGENKTAYNRAASYPGGIGLGVLSWARRVAGDLAPVRDAVRALRVVTEADTPTPQDVERLADFTDLTVDRSVWIGGQRHERDHPSWYQLLFLTQGSPELILRAGVVEDASTFPADSLLAEWGYVVDLTTGEFEVYTGFQSEPHAVGRFADMEPARPNYFPVRLVASWPLSDLPDDNAFLNTLTNNEE